MRKTLSRLTGEGKGAIKVLATTTYNGCWLLLGIYPLNNLWFWFVFTHENSSGKG
jgi:hypothetical protein